MKALEDLVITTRTRAMSHFVLFSPDGSSNNWFCLCKCMGQRAPCSVTFDWVLSLSFSHCLFSLSLFRLLSPPSLPLTLSRSWWWCSTNSKRVILSLYLIHTYLQSESFLLLKCQFKHTILKYAYMHILHFFFRNSFFSAKPWCSYFCCDLILKRFLGGSLAIFVRKHNTNYRNTNM